MYKWPQGRIIRTIALVLALVIAADLGFNGAWAQLSTYESGVSSIRLLIVGGIYAALTLTVLVIGVVGAGFRAKTVDFLIEVEGEMGRVTWPTTNELIRSTIVIAIMVVVLGITIFAVDWFNLQVLFKALYGGGK